MNYSFMHPAEQIVMILNRIYTKKMTSTSGGNLSIIDNQGNIWITPSGIDKGSLSFSNIIILRCPRALLTTDGFNSPIF